MSSDVKEVKVLKRKKIFSAGTYKKPDKNGDLKDFTFTEKYLEEIVANYNELYASKGFKPIIRIDHRDSSQTNNISLVPHLKMGEVSNVFLNNSDLYCDLELYPEVYDLWTSGRLNSVSVEIKPQLTSKDGQVFKNVLTGLALLGSSIPELWDVVGITEYSNNEVTHEFNFNKFNFSMEEDIEMIIVNSPLPVGSTVAIPEVETQEQQEQENMTEVMLAKFEKRLLDLEDENKTLKQSFAIQVNDSYLKGKAEGINCNNSELQMSLTKTKEELVKWKANFLQEKATRELSELDEFVFSLEKEKITLPKHRDAIKDFMLKCTDNDTQLDFSVDNEVKKLSSRDAFKNLLKNLEPKNLPFDDILPDEGTLNFSITLQEKELIRVNPNKKDEILKNAEKNHYMKTNKLDPSNASDLSKANTYMREKYKKTGVK